MGTGAARAHGQAAHGHVTGGTRRSGGGMRIARRAAAQHVLRGRGLDAGHMAVRGPQRGPHTQNQRGAYGQRRPPTDAAPAWLAHLRGPQLCLCQQGGRRRQPAQLPVCHFGQLFQAFHCERPPSSFKMLSSFFLARERRLEMVPSGKSSIWAISPMP